MTVLPSDSFPRGVAERLNWYVYRLIDPRNGETFYIGKGKGDRIFAHANGDFDTVGDEDALDLRMQRIKEIKATGLDVGHVVHRHGIRREALAYEIEAALIDAYPGLTNIAGGHGSGDFGARHVEEIIRQYAAEPFEVREPLVLISIGATFHDENRDVYDAVRYSWKVDVNNVQKRNLVLAHNRGTVVGAYRPEEWLPATAENFPGKTTSPGRWAFNGKPADAGEWDYYLGKQVPDKYRRRGAANPVRYCDPD